MDVVTKDDGDAAYYDSKEVQLRRAYAQSNNTDNITNVGDRVRLSRWKGSFHPNTLDIIYLGALPYISRLNSVVATGYIPNVLSHYGYVKRGKATTLS